MKIENKLLITHLIKNAIKNNLSFIDDLEGEEKEAWKEENKELNQLLKCKDLK